MKQKSHIILFLCFCMTAGTLFARIDPENVKKIFGALQEFSSMRLGYMKSKYNVDIEIEKVLNIDGNFFKTQRTIDDLMEEVYQHYKTMDDLNKLDSIEQNMDFIKSLSPDQIIRIYNLRNIYGAFSKELDLQEAPYLSVAELDGIYFGRSAIQYATDYQRSFQKIFFKMKDFGFTYTLGYNVSRFPLMMSGHGFFRVHQSTYPVYNEDGSSNWRGLQSGSVSLSYEKYDLGVFEGQIYNKFFPRISNYNEYYDDEGRNHHAFGFLIYGHLKDQIFQINKNFICSKAFRDPEGLPGTHFILVKQCPQMDPEQCPMP